MFATTIIALVVGAYVMSKGLTSGEDITKY